jgi:hypothetical protein
MKEIGKCRAMRHVLQRWIWGMLGEEAYSNQEACKSVVGSVTKEDMDTKQTEAQEHERDWGWRR